LKAIIYLSDNHPQITQISQSVKSVDGFGPLLTLTYLEYIVDINRIPNLDYITESDGHLKIGTLALVEMKLADE